MPVNPQKPDSSDAPPDSEGAEGQVSPERIERLFKEHNEALLCFLNSRLHSWTEAKDVAQEAYVRLLGLDQQRGVSYLQAYLYKIAGNLAMDRIRMREVRDRHAHLMFFDAQDREYGIPSAEAESIQRQERERLEQAVARLPARCRLVFTLVEFEGQAVKSVAEHLGTKPDAVRQQLHRAYEYLAQELTESFGKGREPQ